MSSVLTAEDKWTFANSCKTIVGVNRKKTWSAEYLAQVRTRLRKYLIWAGVQLRECERKQRLLESRRRVAEQNLREVIELCQQKGVVDGVVAGHVGNGLDNGTTTLASIACAVGGDAGRGSEALQESDPGSHSGVVDQSAVLGVANA